MDSSKERYISELKEWVARYELQIEQKDKRIAELEAALAEERARLDFFRYGSCTDAAGRKLK